jgi:hypothetical protein
MYINGLDQLQLITKSWCSRSQRHTSLQLCFLDLFPLERNVAVHQSKATKPCGAKLEYMNDPVEESDSRVSLSSYFWDIYNNENMKGGDFSAPVLGPSCRATPPIPHRPLNFPWLRSNLIDSIHNLVVWNRTNSTGPRWIFGVLCGEGT